MLSGDKKNDYSKHTSQNKRGPLLLYMFLFLHKTSAVGIYLMCLIAYASSMYLYYHTKYKKVTINQDALESELRLTLSVYNLLGFFSSVVHVQCSTGALVPRL